MSTLFRNTHFLLIEDTPGDLLESDKTHGELTNAEIEGLIVEHGGSLETRTGAKSLGAIEALKINHIITRTTSFAEYLTAAELMIPMTNPRWLVDSSIESVRKNYRFYSPKPTPFMDKVMLCIADNLAQGDKEIMYSGVRAFGGQYLDALSRYTTHLVALDVTNNKSIIAANIKRADDPDIKIVLPHWIDECMRQQRHVDEQPFLLMNPKVLQTGKPDKSLETNSENEGDSGCNDNVKTKPKSQVLLGKRVYLATDYNLSEHLKKSVISLVENCGGSVQSEFDSELIDIYMGKYRSGLQFKTCILNDKIEVASLQWLYYVVMNKCYVSPLMSNMLHFPKPEDDIAQFQNMRISITGITSDARHYLSSLIGAMGATFTKTLDCNNDFLVCAQKSGEKYAAAKSRWPDIKIVNHLWIEECYAKWLFLDPRLPRYSTISPSTQLLGKVRISKTDITKIWQTDDDKVSNVSDSINEEDDDCLTNRVNPSSIMLTPLSKTVSETANTTAGSSQAMEQTSSSREPIMVEEQLAQSSPVAGVYVRAGRSAKAKAASKLHSDMEDLNEYTSMSKSSRKMKTYMEQLENTVTPSKTVASKKASTPSKTNADEISEVQEPQPKKAKISKKIHMVAILTGCEPMLTLNKSDLSKLTKVGIQILNDYNSKKPIDTIVAPKVLRTEKFLKSLSKARRILHPSFLSDILKRNSLSTLTWSELTKEFNFEDYSLDKVSSVKQINEDLGVTEETSGFHRLLSHEGKPVFEGMSVNLSSNLNGGPDLISSILQEHGLSSSKIIKLSAGTRKSGLLTMEDGTSILVAHKGKDKKAASSLEGVTVVEWEWCVKSIFHKSVQSFNDYIIKP